MQKEAIEGFRLSPQQRRLWSLQQTNQNMPRRAQAAVLIEGTLDAATLDDALRQVVRRHEILRTTFYRADGVEFPVQVIGDDGVPAIRHLSLDEAQSSDPEHAYKMLSRDPSQHAPDDEGETALRVSLVRLSSSTHLLHADVHSMCTDAEGLNALVREMARSYGGATAETGEADELMQYADLSESLNQVVEAEEGKTAAATWRGRDFSAAFRSKLPFESEPNAQQNFDPELFERHIAPALTQKIKASAARHGVHTSLFLQACWYLLLSKLTQQPEITVSVTFDGRAFYGLGDLPGLFAHAVPVSCWLGDGVQLADFLRQLNLATDEARESQLAFSFESLTQPSANGHGAASFFPFGFEFSESTDGFEAGGLRWTPYQQRVCAERFTIKLRCVSRAGQDTSTEFHYDRSSLSGAAVERIGRYYHQLLESAVVLDEEAGIEALEILDDAEQRRLLMEFNDTRETYATDLCLHHPFEAQAAATPQAVALRFRSDSLSYSQLDGRASTLARRLLALELPSDSTVAVLCRRSLAMPAALLGVLKAGAAYLPLDPDYPVERLRFMLEDSGARALLAEPELAEQLGAHGLPLVPLPDGDAAWSEAEAASTAPISSTAVSPDDLAYVMYTSGSTGKPKGVMVTHRGVVNCLQWMQQSYGLDASDSFLFKTSLGFDPSVWELFWPLWVGGRCVIAEPGGQFDPVYLLRLVADEAVTSAYFVPSLLREVAEADGLETAGRTLRRVICGGEVLPTEVMRRFMQRVPLAELRHSYGPTETSIATNEWTCEATAKRALMGRPLGNVQAYVLDARMQLLPEGVAGELYLGGEGVARGYRNRPELTAERFVPDSFSGTTGERLYKTGDVVRWAGDGLLEYVGRDDGQVKVRGYRIETGEVEAALRQHASVSEAVAVVRESEDGDKQLVSYLICADGQPPRAEELREHMKQLVPDYMVPQSFVVLKEWPLMVNGKVDKKALPAPDEAKQHGKVSQAEPRNETEEVLAAIWSHVLGVEQVGVDDNFFDLGGDSIRSVRAVALAKQRGLRLTVQQLFRSQTIAALVREQDLRTGGEASEAGPATTKPFDLISTEDRDLLPADIEDAYPLSMMQGAMLYHMEMTPDAPAYHNVNSWYLRAHFDAEALREAVRQVAARHAVLRTSFDLTNYSRPLQLVHRQAELPLEVYDITHLSSGEQEGAIRDFLKDQRAHVFDLSSPSQMRFYVHRRSADSFQFSLAENHAILDGWSTTSTLAEVAERYLALVAGEETASQLPPEVSFRDFINLELQALASTETQRYWTRQLSDATPVRLPGMSQAAPASVGSRVVKMQLHLDEEVYEGLRRAARKLAVPLKTVAFAAHLKVLSLLSGQVDLLAGITTNGRPEESGGTNVRGNFLNTVPFRFKFDGGTWGETIRRVFDGEWAMLPHRRYPLGALQKSWGRETLLETNFAFLHFHSMDEMLRGGKVEVIGDEATDLSETNFGLLTHFVINSTSLNKKAWVDMQFDMTMTTPELRDAVSGYYDRVLRSIAADLSARHEAENYLSPAEQEHLLAAAAGNETESEPSACLHELFEAQAARTPDAVAAVFGDERLSYGELDARADRLANHLRSLGVGAEVLVGVLLERSTDVLVALLGVLKAGGAYVPLDPSNPRERLAFILKDAAASVLLTQRRFVEELPAHASRVVCLDADLEGASDDNKPTTPNVVRPDNTAYVIYTSGSTGQPKGTLITHGGLSNYLTWCARAYRAGEGTGALVHSSVSFDLTVTGLFAPLLSGQRVVFAPEGVGVEPLVQTLKEEKDLGLVKITPAQLQLLNRQLTPEEAAGRTRRFVIGGESLQAEVLRFWQDAAPEIVLINEYGPTETVVGCCVYEVPAGEHLAGAVPIGRPISNTQLYLLDRFLQLAPVGVAAELYIGGAGVARGYLNRPDLTAERFVPNPFAPKTGGRLYRTGDLARYRADGQLEFLGRLDDQLKIHGYRVEADEVSATLRQHSSLREAFVTAYEEPGGDKRLVAYLVAGEQTPSESDLRDFLKEKLPEYMIPSAFVWLDALPLTVGGKVDRRALPAPGVLRPQLATAYVAPQGDVEEIIAGLWREVLQVERVGIHDNFFDLGGDSFGVYEVFSKLHKALASDLSILDLFKYPTVSALAHHLKSLGQGQRTVPSSEETKERARKRSQANSRRRQLTKDKVTKDKASGIQPERGVEK
jgi:amino acid adenylation domain-containing protein